jgi:hypothetical protein
MPHKTSFRTTPAQISNDCGTKKAINISIFVSCIVLKIYKTKGKEVAGKIDLLTGSFLLVSYVLLMTIFCVGS